MPLIPRALQTKPWAEGLRPPPSPSACGLGLGLQDPVSGGGRFGGWALYSPEHAAFAGDPAGLWDRSRGGEMVAPFWKGGNVEDYDCLFPTPWVRLERCPNTSQREKPFWSGRN